MLGLRPPGLEFQRWPKTSVISFHLVIYVLLILTKNKKSSKNLKSLRKTKLFLFPSRIQPCKQNCMQYTALYTTNTHRLRRWNQEDTAVTQCERVRIWGISLQHRLSAQRWAGDISIQPSFRCTNSLFVLSLDSWKR